MAKVTAASGRTKSAAKPRPRRASQHTVVNIDLTEDSLRALMVEQYRNGDGYITVYRGTRADLAAAGVPDVAFPNQGSEARSFQLQTINACCTGTQELLSGTMQSVAAGFELEVDWGAARPYLQGSHPALCELARMMLIDVLAWTSDDKPADLAHPIDMLIEDEQADYKPRPDAPRFQVTPEFHQKMRDFASRAYQFVFTEGEVLPSTSAAVKRPPHLRLVDNTAPAVQS